jgi:hypothetical protein
MRICSPWKEAFAIRFLILPARLAAVNTYVQHFSKKMDASRRESAGARDGAILRLVDLLVASDATGSRSISVRSVGLISNRRDMNAGFASRIWASRFSSQ